MPVTEPSQTAFEPLIKEECPNSLKTMASDKPLGLMTFRPNFIKFSGVTLKVIYLICLSISQRRGLITLLPPPPKKKPADLLKNWRPITLPQLLQDRI